MHLAAALNQKCCNLEVQSFLLTAFLDVASVVTGDCELGVHVKIASDF